MTGYVASRVFVDADRVIAPGAVGVAQDRILSVGTPREVLRSLPPESRTVEFRGAAIVPGLVNAHTHLQIPPLGTPPGSAGARGSFVDWILEVIRWRRGASPGEFRGNLLRACGQALSFGTTAAGEIAGPDPGAYEGIPLRARVFAEGIGFHPEAAEAAARAVEASVERLRALSAADPRISVGLSPHTLYTVGGELLRRLGEIARRESLPVSIHLAESAAEAEFLRGGGGEIAARLYPAVGKDVSFFRGLRAGIPSALEEAGIPLDRLTAVHVVHLPPEDLDLLAARGTRFVLCPRSNLRHGNGAPDVTRLVDRGIPFALGTDSLGSVPELSPWEEARTAAGLYRGTLPEESLARVLFRSMTENGAETLRLPCGALRQGLAADFAVVPDPGGKGGASYRRLVEQGGAGPALLTVVGGAPGHGRVPA